MTKFYVPPQDKPLYGRTTGDRYEYEKKYGLWFSAHVAYTLQDVYAREPDGLTDVPPVKVGDTVRTEEELEALPDGTILRAENGAWEKVDGCFFFAGSGDAFDGSGIAAGGSTLTILWLPETGDRA